MRILLLNFILHTAENGVITRRATNRHTMIYSMARGFQKAGHEVTLLASEEYKPLEDENPGFEVVFFKSKMKKIFRPDLLPYPKGLTTWLKKNSGSYDLAITSETFMIPSLLAARDCKCKVVVWHELEAYQRMMHEIPAKVWYNIVVPLFMKKMPVIARSGKAREFISRFMPNVAKTIVDHGADADIFYPSEEVDDSFVVISQLIGRKRIDSIIEKFSKFINLPDRETYKLHIIGDGPERGALEQLTIKLGIESSVEFHGYLFHSDSAPISRRAKALLINTERDLNMVSVPESIVNGTPVLMNTVPNTADFVNKEKLGIAKEEWGEHELLEMTRRYDEFHSNCKRVRERLTNCGCAKNIVDIAEKL